MIQNLLFAIIVLALGGLGWALYATRSRWLPKPSASAAPQDGRQAIEQLWRRVDAVRRLVNVNDQRQLKLAMDNPPADLQGRYALLCMVYREACEYLRMAKEYGWTDSAVAYKIEALTAAMKQLSEFFVKDLAQQLKPSRSLNSPEWFRAMASETCAAFEASRFIFEAARSAKAQKPA